MPSKAMLTILTAVAICLAPGALVGQAPLLPAPLISPDATGDEASLVKVGGLGIADYHYNSSFDQNQQHALVVDRSAAVNGALIGGLAGGLAGIAVGSFIDQGVGMGGSSGALLLGLGGAAAGALVGGAIGHVAANR